MIKPTDTPSKIDTFRPTNPSIPIGSTRQRSLRDITNPFDVIKLIKPLNTIDLPSLTVLLVLTGSIEMTDRLACLA